MCLGGEIPHLANKHLMTWLLSFGPRLACKFTLHSRAVTIFTPSAIVKVCVCVCVFMGVCVSTSL